MTRTMHITLILSLLLLSRAIDLGKWELFAEDTKEITVRRLRMGRVKASGGTPAGFPLEVLDRTTQAWVDFDNERGSSFTISLNVDYWFNIGGTLRWKSRNSPYPGAILPTCFPSQLACIEHNDRYCWFTGSTDRDTPHTTTIRRFDMETQSSMALVLSDVVSLAAEPITGNTWAVKSNGDIFRATNLNWFRQRYGKANFITFGRTIDPYIVSQDVVDGGFAIKKWNALLDDWETIPGIGGVFVALDDDDNLYVVTNNNKVYRQKGIISVYCPMCNENWGSYGGVCSSENNQCLNCPAGSYAVDSPLRCKPCPAHCKECSSATTCTACPDGQFLIADGTCLDDCDHPLVDDIIAGVQICKGPCVTDPAGSFYYPSDQSCHPTCEVPIVGTTNPLYESCDYCPDNCLTCASATECLQCELPYFLYGEICISACEDPMEDDVDGDGYLQCKGPCPDNAEPYYYPSDESCRATCGLPIPTQFYDSCGVCPDNCFECLSSTSCLKCTLPYVRRPNGVCELTCGPGESEIPVAGGYKICLQ